MSLLLANRAVQKVSGVSIDPEVSAWETRVIANSGTVSATTLDRVNTFVLAVKSAGLRSRFLRLNLFIGDQLAACLTPLFLNNTESITVFDGNTYDTNNNFVGGDYSESGVSGGLQGDLTNKSLNTGFNPNSVSAMSNNHGLITYSRSATSALVGRYYMHCFSGAPNTNIYLLPHSAGLIYRISDFSSTVSTNNTFNKLYLSYRQGTSKKLLENGVLDSSVSIAFIAKPNDNIWVFSFSGGGGETDALLNCYGITDSIADDTEANTISTLLNDFYTLYSRNEY